jgi:hypothetical protein
MGVLGAERIATADLRRNLKRALLAEAKRRDARVELDISEWETREPGAR